MDTLITKMHNELSERLAKLCRQFRFRWACPSVIGDDEVQLSAVQVPGQGAEVELMIGIACSERLRQGCRGFHWIVRNSRTGDTVRSGVTKQSNCFRLGSLAGGEYAVDIHPLSDAAPTPTKDLEALVAFILLTPEKRAESPHKQTVLRFDASHHGGWQGTLNLQLSGGGGVKQYQAGHGAENWDYDEETVWLNCPRAKIPNGLLWIILRESDGTVSEHLPKLDFNAQTGHWLFRTSFQELLDGRKLHGQPTLAFLPATPENRAAFLGEKVRAFVDDLPKNGSQRKLAETFLSAEKSENA